MADERPQTLQTLLLGLLPDDHTAVGNISLLEQFLQAAQASGTTPAATAEDFKQAREALVARGQAIKGKGRGGATARASGPDRPPLDLNTPAAAPATPNTPTAQAAAAPAQAAQAQAKKPHSPDAGEPQVLAYRHPDRRKNNPEVGLVNEHTDPEQPKTRWAYDPHLDPALQFDSARASAEKLIEDALAGDDPAAMRHALQTLQRMSAPYLQWTGKAERTSFAVDTVSLHVHERIDAMSILSAAAQRQKTQAQKTSAQGFQPGLFEAPFESVPLRSALDFYKHDRGWANRLVAGDSLLVMNSLLHKEGMAGQVQMIYIDPPYGIKYGSNFQPFVGKRDVKDRSDADLTQEPEMIKAFRDTWELGIHSYLTYLRDRLLLAKDLLSETGSVFVQISEENIHLVRNLLQEIFGENNFVSLITVVKTSAQEADTLSNVCDYIIWYAKSKSKLKYKKIWLDKLEEDSGAAEYNRIEIDGYKRRLMTREELIGETPLKNNFIRYRQDNIVSQRPPGSFPVAFQGHDYVPLSGYWKTGIDGFKKLIASRRIEIRGRMLSYVRFLDDFPVRPISNFWSDVRFSSRAEDKSYIVQTSARVIERCMLMTTDPGDLVLDPTCGSGTTAYVAEKWGRRWITCDTSRVAITLAKQRLMTASFDYFALRYPHEGLKGGFIYKTVPHVTLKSIANNPEIDAIYERLHPAIEAALAVLNQTLKTHPPATPYPVPEGVRKGHKLVLGMAGQDLLEWEVPFDAPADWSAALHTPLQAFHAARQSMQAQMDRSIAANADSETLYDQPEKDKAKRRVCGPFTVEAVPFPTVLSLDAQAAPAPQGPEAGASLARSGHTSRQHTWRDELLKTGIRGKGGQMLRFAELEVLPGTVCLHASGTLDTGERAVVSFGPEHAALEPRQVGHALDEASDLFPRPKLMVFCAFAFDPEAAKDIDALRGITALKVQMNTDLLTEDLKKAKSNNQSFWLMGQPDVELSPTAGGLWQVEVNGFDYFDTSKGELVSGGKGKIAAWSLDTDYDGRSLFPHQVFFPMAGQDEGWMKLKKDIRAELDETLLKAFTGTVSLPFEAGANRTVAVKIVDDRGIESLKVMKLDATAQSPFERPQPC
jgi:adenine-specific DNA-methyltransferase